jgi:hypothetical protein
MDPAGETRFLNCDLELDSRQDLAALGTHLGDRVLVLFSGLVQKEWYRLALEPLGDDLDADGCIQQLAALVAGLPPDLRRLWRSCHSRVFDLGFEGGTHALPYVTDLRPTTLRALAEVEAKLRITFYPPSAC